MLVEDTSGGGSCSITVYFVTMGYLRCRRVRRKTPAIDVDTLDYRRDMCAVTISIVVHVPYIDTVVAVSGAKCTRVLVVAFPFTPVTRDTFLPRTPEMRVRLGPGLGVVDDMNDNSVRYKAYYCRTRAVVPKLMR